MRYFIDSADTEAIKACWDTGLIDGVTTNPTLIRKSGKKPEDVYAQLIDWGIPDVSMEVSGSAQEMFDEGRRLSSQYGKAATIKLPMTIDGLIACQGLSKQLIRTNVTLIFNVAQALLAAKAGATYVSPFVGRIDDQGYAGLEVVRGIAGTFAATGQRTEVLAASIRTPHRAVRSVANGAAIATMPPDVFWSMFNHVLTEQGLDIFEKDIQQIS